MKDHFSDESTQGTPAVGPPGTIVVADWSILHRRAEATAQGFQRHMLKLSFYRSSYPPRRDWLRTPGFELATADYSIGPYAEWGERGVPWVHAEPAAPTAAAALPSTTSGPGSLHFLDRFIAAKFFWLCGEPAPTFLGGPAWPAHYGANGRGGRSSYGAPGSAGSTHARAWRGGAASDGELAGEVARLREEMAELKALLQAKL